MWKRARAFSQVELEYLKAHSDYPMNQLCIALSNTKNQIKVALTNLDGKAPSTKKFLPGNKSFRSKIGKRKYLNNQFFRSSWEANVYRYMLYLYTPKTSGVIIQYEPTDFTFWQFGIKKGTVSYTPDFKLIHPDGSYEWIEVKGGFLKSSDKTKLRRFKKYFPDEFKRLVAVTPGKTSKTAKFFTEIGVDIKWEYPSLNKEFKKVIINWE